MSKTTAPAFPLLSGDWLKGTARLTAAERGYYLDLLLYTWDGDEPIPSDEREQMQIARCTSRAEWRKVWERLKTKWYVVDGGFRNRKCEEQRASLQAFRAGKSENGKKGAGKRWQGHTKKNGKAHGKPMAETLTNGWPSSSFSSSEDQNRPAEDGGPTRAREAAEPVWGHGNSHRSSGLVGNHTGCFFAPAACARGACIPAKLGTQWLQQCAEMVDPVSYIHAFVAEFLSTLRPGPIGDDLFALWRAAWNAHHGSQAPATPNGRENLTEHNLRAGREAITGRPERPGRMEAVALEDGK